jgi:triphosphatase
MEIELKLLVDAQFEEAVLRHPLLSSPDGVQARELDQQDTYFDTPELKLRKRQIGLRIRRSRGRWIQNIKGNGSAAGGLHSRHEWERSVAGPVPELDHLRALIDDKAVRRDLGRAPALKKRLAPVFATKVRRTAWEVQLRDGGQVECALDRGTLECGDKTIPISELELELKSGDAGQLFDLALALQNDIPVRVGQDSKADRGYALLQAQAEGAVKATRPALSRSMTTEQAFVDIAASCLAHIQGNDQRVAEGIDVESLHQMRVGMRRLRSALSMFNGLLHLPAELQAELDWLAAELGEARDWDVLSGSTLPALARQAADTVHIDNVQQTADDEAEAQRRRTAAAVASPRYTRLVLSLGRWVHAMGWRADQDNSHAGKLAQPVVRFARDVLRRDQKRLRERARNLATATPEMRHRLRIAAKKTRYATEFFGALFTPGTVRPYLQGLTQLQDELGLLNDYAVAEQLLTGLSTSHPQLEGDVGFVKGFLAAHMHRNDKKIVRLWKQFAPLAPPG